MHQYMKFQHNQAMHDKVIEALANFPGTYLRGAQGDSSLRWAEQTTGRTKNDHADVQIQFRYIVSS